MGGERQGKGTETSEEGEYVGDFLKGKKEGKATLTKVNGEVYTGDFVDGRF